MNTERLVLADEVWEKVSPHLPGKATDCGVTAADNRLLLEAVWWRIRTVKCYEGGVASMAPEK